MRRQLNLPVNVRISFVKNQIIRVKAVRKVIFRTAFFGVRLAAHAGDAEI